MKRPIGVFVTAFAIAAAAVFTAGCGAAGNGALDPIGGGASTDDNPTTACLFGSCGDPPEAECSADDDCGAGLICSSDGLCVIHATGGPAGNQAATGGKTSTKSPYKKLLCPKVKSFSGEEGTAFLQQIAMRGGSGEYELERVDSDSKPFPEWLDSDSDSLTAQTPQTGKYEFKLKAVDATANKKRTCSYSLLVRGPISLATSSGLMLKTPPTPFGDIKTPYAWYSKVTASGSGTKDLTWTLDSSTSSAAANLCFSATKPDPDSPDFSCGSLPPTGNTIYAWLKSDPKDGGKTDVTVQAQGAWSIKPAQAAISLPHGKPRAVAVADDETQPEEEPVGRIQIQLMTGTHNGGVNSFMVAQPDIFMVAQPDIAGIVDGMRGIDAATTCPIVFEICVDQNFTDGCQAVTLWKKGGFRAGYFETFTSSDSGGLAQILEELTEKHRYFRLTLKKVPTGTWGVACDSPSMISEPSQHADAEPTSPLQTVTDDRWFLEGVKLGIILPKGKKYQYTNPCLNRWLVPGESLSFGPKDGALCLVTTVGSSGTDDDVWLAVKSTADVDAVDWQDTAWDTFTAHPDSNWPFGGGGLIGIRLDYRGYLSNVFDDFESGMTTSYGVYAFDQDPFSDEFSIWKKGNDTNFVLQRYELFLYKPGKMADSKAVVRFGQSETSKTLSDITKSTGWQTVEEIPLAGFPYGFDTCGSHVSD